MAIVDYFLKLDGIQGESNDSKHKNEIEIESFSWGEAQSGTASFGGGMGGGKVQMQDFHFVMRVNKASPKLMLACATGDHIKNGILICRKAGKEQQEYLKVVFTDLMVSSYQMGGSPGASVLPLEQIDAQLKIQGFTDGGQLHAATPQKLGEWTGADSLLYSTIESFDYINVGFYTQRRVKILSRLVSAKTGVETIREKTELNIFFMAELHLPYSDIFKEINLSLKNNNFS